MAGWLIMLFTVLIFAVWIIAEARKETCERSEKERQKLHKKKEQENAQRKCAKRLTMETAEKAAEEKAEELHGNGRIKADPLEKSKELESQPTEDLQTVVEKYESAQSSSANSGSTLEEIQRRVNEYEKAAIAAKDAGKIKSAGLFVKLFHDEDAMKEIARSTMIGIFMLLKYELAEARTTYDDLMKELNRTYTYVNMERLDRQNSGNRGNNLARRAMNDASGNIAAWRKRI